jgi:hypothetical protein
VGVDVEGRAHRGVPQPFGDRHGVHTLFQQLACVAVAQDVERCALGQPRLPADPRHGGRHRVRVQRRAVRVSEDQVEIGPVAVVLLEARVGVEPTYKGFADLCLTTWLPRLWVGSTCKIARAEGASQTRARVQASGIRRLEAASGRAPAGACSCRHLQGACTPLASARGSVRRRAGRSATRRVSSSLPALRPVRRIEIRRAARKG